MRYFVTAFVALSLLAGCGGDGNKPLREQPGYEDAHSEAQLYCTLAGVVGPYGPESLYDPEYLACVREETRRNMQKQD